MAYTVKQLAKISGVSVRTLHWYDEKGLLKPSYHGSNGYRYYEEEQLFMLQQILFFRELGFNLNDIQKLLSHDDFDKVRALQSHKQVLTEETNRKSNLIKTIDKTISHLRGKETMKDNELYYGFDKKFRKDEIYTGIAKNTPAEKLEQFKKEEVDWGEEQWLSFKNNADELKKKIAKAIEDRLQPESNQVQELINEHYKMQAIFFDLTHEAYLLLICMYEDDVATIKSMFEAYHPEMQSFICKAMRHYADKNL